ncbi:site-specific integrase [Ferrimicrobium sp.]|uniref:tyrosine-type recombinase/integrase n=1 Tax=Ferrimicrobium sp. TaxID=2926050 RepID=UPI002615CC86|nr:site-specific integrase [Ferrimicrobium sp.]
MELPRDPATGKRRRQWATVKGTKRKAQYESQQLLVKVQDSSTLLAAGSGLSTEQVVNEWFAIVREGLSPTTVQGYEWRIRLHILPALGSIPVHKLRALDLDHLYRSLIAQGKAPATIRQTHAIIRSALNQAMRWGWVKHNVALLATPPKLGSTAVVAPSISQLNSILEAAKKRHPQWVNLIALAALTGMRRGELCALRWEDIGAGSLHVSRSLGHTTESGTYLGPTKSRQERRVALDSAALYYITDQQERLREACRALSLKMADNPFVFFGEPDGATPLHPDSVSKVFRSICDGLGYPELHFHSLRHFSATQLIASGVDIRTVSARLGHGDPAVTLRVYSHLLEARDRDAAVIMGNILTGKSGEQASDAGAR